MTRSAFTSARSPATRESPDAWQHLGDVLLRIRIFGRAADAYREVIRLNGHNEHTYLNLFRCLVELGQLEQAERVAEAMRRVYPGAENGRPALSEIAQARFDRVCEARRPSARCSISTMRPSA